MRRNIMHRPPRGRLQVLEGMYTVSPELAAVFSVIRRVARSDCTLLISGETGSGKELAAHAIHAHSPRAKRPFQVVNCATLSPTLLESTLFGHVRGAFTDAIRDRKGVFALADKGTLFLDEIAEIPLDLQGRLLRVLQERTFVPVGATRPVSVDVRLISATNKILRREVAEGRFRADLSYRIRVVPIALPPLRERTGDAEALLWHFVDELNARGPRRVTGLTSAAAAALRRYPWPGNVRELRNVVECAFVLGDGPTIDLDQLTPEIRGDLTPRSSPADDPLGAGERERLAAALTRSRGRRGVAARILGISRSTLWRKMREHRL